MRMSRTAPALAALPLAVTAHPGDCEVEAEVAPTTDGR